MNFNYYLHQLQVILRFLNDAVGLPGIDKVNWNIGKLSGQIEQISIQ
jgi:hypothetical protein